MKKNSNLQLIRFVAAILVMVSHAFPLSGSSEGDLLMHFSGGTYSFGNFSVQVLFLLSGFLSAVSLMGKKNVSFAYYLKRRLNRLVPPLAATVGACVLLGVFLSDCSSGEYFTSPQTYKYLLNSVFILVHDLPGVFTRNVYGSTVNGSLWTMPVEMLCCLAVFVLYAFHLLDRKKILCTVPLVAIFAVAGGRLLPELLTYAVKAGLMFYLGILYAVYRDKISFHPWAIGLTGTLFLLFVYLGLPYIGVYGFLHYCIMGICFFLPQCSRHLAGLGDYSYCLYLWGWPVQQTVVHFFGGNGMSPVWNYLLSIPIASMLAIMTHKLVEEKCIRKMTTVS